jgi:glutamine amidotransferase-like uncharacterized protein
MIQSCSNDVECSRDSRATTKALCRGLAINLFLLMLSSCTISGIHGDKGGMPRKGASDAAVAASGHSPILLFNGTGASPNDVAAVEIVLNSNHLSYSTANSSQMNRMSESQLQGYRLLIIPGGNFIDIGRSLTSSAATNIHNAVQNGLNYLGICAGAFLAGNSSYYNGLNLTSGVKFGFYSAEEKGIRKAAVPIAVAGGPTLEQYWEDGPQLSGWGAVVGKYSDGTPAIVEGTSGRGWVILSGIHPEAPPSWRRGMSFSTPAEIDNAYAGTLVKAALNGTSLSHF